MVAEVAALTGRRPREVYREESVRTMFLTWAYAERGRMRTLEVLLSALAPAAEGVPPGGRASSAPSKVRDAARRAARETSKVAREVSEADAAARRWAARTRDRYRPRRGGEVSGNTVIVDIDDPGALAAYEGRHPAMSTMIRPGRGRG